MNPRTITVTYPSLSNSTLNVTLARSWIVMTRTSSSQSNLRDSGRFTNDSILSVSSLKRVKIKSLQHMRNNVRTNSGGRSMVNCQSQSQQSRWRFVDSRWRSNSQWLSHRWLSHQSLSQSGQSAQILSIRTSWCRLNTVNTVKQGGVTGTFREERSITRQRVSCCQSQPCRREAEW